MDKATRNNIQRATQQARRLLEEEFREQLEGTYDILLDGTMADVPGSHLSEAEQVLRRKLIAVVAHKVAAGFEPSEAVAAYLREAAFTALNRFVALKMLEARGLVQQCISQGTQSNGFKEFMALAPGLVALKDNAYHLYIETIFDEIAQEVGVLFDRKDASGLLRPRPLALKALLTLLNDQLLSSVWAEDETIGWVYQYFNSDDERRQMRAESQIPRNSREMAVRNQFFTPRYVVRFLTDNTLGRIWYEMRQGETSLGELSYLVTRPNEIFLSEGDEPPPHTSDSDIDNRDLSQDELSELTFYVPFRMPKDPRDLRVLDPACGSGHFLLYVFDLLLKIYEEAWGAERPPLSAVTGRTLREDYPSLLMLRAAAPELILRHNLHGVDIDSRCAQICALGLWMRAQKAYDGLNIERSLRPTIQKTNVVVAESMPGDRRLRREFSDSLEARAGQMVEHIFDRMELAGEAGSLLRIEDDIRDAAMNAYGQHGALFRTSDEESWLCAEEEILKALRGYAAKTSEGHYFQRRLFAEDAVRGLGFIDLCLQRYDVILMNPPFGAATPEIQDIVRQVAPFGAKNLAAAFAETSASRLAAGGCIGQVSDRVIFVKSTYENFRRKFLLTQLSLGPFVSLGWDVLDANVEVVACVLDSSKVKPHYERFVDLTTIGNKGLVLEDPKLHGCTEYWCLSSDFSSLPGAAIAFDLPPSARNLFRRLPTLKDAAHKALQGHNLSMLWFGRMWWEVPLASITNREFIRMYKGGSYCRYYQPSYEVAIWKDDGNHLRPHAGTRWSNEEWQGLGGIGYGKRGDFLDAHVMNSDQIFTVEGLAIFPAEPDDYWGLLGYLNSSVTSFLLSFYSGQHKGGGYLAQLPVPKSIALRNGPLTALVREVYERKRVIDQTNELSPIFASPFLQNTRPRSLFSAAKDLFEFADETVQLSEKVDSLVCDIVGCSREAILSEPFMKNWPEDVASVSVQARNESAARHHLALSWISFLIGVAMGRWRSDHPVSGVLDEDHEPTGALPSIPPACIGRTPKLGILPDDEGAPSDIIATIEALAAELFQEESGDVLLEVITELSGEPHKGRDWVRHRFFDAHIHHYSKGRTRAPIYWQLSTPSASYSVWLYYHCFTSDTIYRVLNEYAIPKLKHEESKLKEIALEAGPTPSASQRKKLQVQEETLAEISAFRDELAKIAPLWNPDLADGVIINFAPLWRLIPHHRAWQEECKRVWGKLLAGEYDWAQLAMHLWPERVVLKCVKDRNFAIAHNLQDLLWAEDQNGKWKPRKVDANHVDNMIRERTSSAVKEALRALLAAPSPSGSAKRKSKKGTRD